MHINNQMQKSKGIKIRSLLIVLIPGLLIISTIIFFATKEYVCKKRLLRENGLKQTAFCYYSKEHMLGNGSRALSTGFYLTYNGVNYKVTTKRFAEPIPVGTPILVRFIPESPDCHEILWDSVVVFNNIRYEFVNVPDRGIVVNSTKVQS
jgi:hypothetical protein